MEDQPTYNKARERVESKLGFYTHLAIYAVVGLLLVTIDIGSSPGVAWAQWPLMGWGIGVLVHALNVFVYEGRSPFFERMIEKERGRDL